MLNELVLTYGLTDEYANTKSAKDACKKNIPWCKYAIDTGAKVVQKNA
jgi:hypothetical protein